MTIATITPQTLVSEVLNQSPQLVLFFLEKKLGCVGCAMVTFCTLAEVCAYYGLDLAAFMQELMEVVESGR